jgi:predicted RecA/RadA family phage recombinase
MSEAILVYGTPTEEQVTATAAHSAGEVIQLPDGRAGIVGGQQATASGDKMSVFTSGTWKLAKTASMVILDGGRVFWDRSASTTLYKAEPNTGDFYLGTAVGDAASADTTMLVALNAKQQNVIELGKGGWANVGVKTSGTVVPNAAVGLTGTQPGGTTTMLSFSATSEAQKTDIMSVQSIPVTMPFIVEGRIAIYDIGDNAALDINVGIANDTHATDADSITESLFLHFDGNSLNINAESDDGTTEVAATDTTIDAVDNTYFDFAIDGRDLTDIQVYINGALVLGSTVFKLNAATGPLKLLAHIEKTANDTLADVRVEHFAARIVDVE